MKSHLFRILIASVLFILPAEAQNLVPWPSSISNQASQFTLNASSRIIYETRTGVPRNIEGSLEPLATVLSEELEMITGLKPVVFDIATQSPGANDIVLRFDAVVGGFAETEAEENQAYTLNSSAAGLTISSQYVKGVAYGTATLLQAVEELDGGYTVPGLLIEDQPASEYRTIMLDVARNVHSIGVIEDVIRTARMFKVRYVHLHLTDNENFTFPFTPITDNLTGNFTYTRQELIDLVAYADARGITLIPELDLPGHSKKIKDSGYLSPNDGNDAEVAAPANFSKIEAIIDDMLSVFTTSPYFHIGGDESAAGSNLEPFLAAMNEHLRGTPTGGKRRMLVWEGFAGQPTTEIPPTGEDRVIVLSWESRYNTPWNLLDAGYQVVNASWRPMYVVGGGGFVGPGNTFGRKFLLDDMYRWNKDRFMHWEPGTPVYEDSGPNDPVNDDGEWDAGNISRRDQVIGGQMLFWEGEEDFILRNLRSRAPIMSERLWNPTKGDDFNTFEARAQAIDERVMTIVQPVEILPFRFERDAQIENLYHSYNGNEIKVTMRNRTKIPGTIRYQESAFSNDFNRIGFNNMTPITSANQAYGTPLTKSGGFAMRAKLFRTDGSPVGGDTWAYYNNWVQRVEAVEYDIGRSTPAVVPDLASFPEDKVVRRYQMPLLRGVGRNVEVRGQKQETLFTPPQDGEFEVSLKSQSGHATLYLDLNRNGTWEADETIIKNTPNNEEWQRVMLNLTSSEPYRLRIDHAVGLPRAVLGVTISGPGTSGRVGVNEFLELPNGGVENRNLRTLIVRGDYENTTIPNGNANWLGHLISITKGVESYWRRHSYGTLEVDQIMTDVYRLPQPASSYSTTESLGQALDVLASAEHDLASYDLIAYFVPVAAPLGEISNSAIPGRLWMSGPTPDQEEFVREFGRALSLGKASAIEGNLVSGSATVFPGEVREERDGLFLLGTDSGFGGVERNPIPAPGGSPEADFSTISVPMRYQAGFLNDSYVQQLTGDGIYRLYEFELDTLPSPRNLGLRISSGGQDWWISFAPKMAQRWSGFNAEGFANGVIVQELAGSDTRLLDFTPGSQGGAATEADYIDTRDGALQIGEVYQFPDTGLALIPLEKGIVEGIQYLDVRLANVDGSISDNTPPTPNPASFAGSPAAASPNSITMMANAGSDDSGLVEYRFVETSGNPGGTSSGWQSSPSYTDDGLTPDTQYSYTVQIQDVLGNKGQASAAESASTDPPLDAGFLAPTAGNTEAADGVTDPWFGGRTPPIWRERAGDAGPFYTADEDFFSPDGDFIQLKTTIPNLKVGAVYEVFLEFGATAQWSIMGGLSPDAIEGFSTANRQIGANQHIGPEDDSGKVTPTGNSVVSGISVLKASLGAIAANAAGEIEVFVDDPDNSEVRNDSFRAWYYGVSYQEVLPDNTPPTPNPASFDENPSSNDPRSVSMRASLGTDDSGFVQYRFIETSGNAGGTSSEWQVSRDYTDEGLTPSTEYSYTVQMRDGAGNEGVVSEAQVVTTSGFLKTGFLEPSIENTEAVDGTDPWLGGRTPPIWRDRRADAGAITADEDAFAPNNDYLQLKTTLRDLVPGGLYEISLDFGGANEWAIMGGLSASSIEGFSTANRTIGANDHIGLDDPSGRVIEAGRDVTAGVRALSAQLGRAVANGNGEIEVFIDDPDNASISPVDRHRCWYDGISFEIVDLYAPWVQEFYGSETDPNIIGFSADPNNDGVQNGIAFLMGISPLVAEPSVTPTGQINGSNVVWQFRSSQRAAAFSPRLEYSTDLLSWRTVNNALPGFSSSTEAAGYGQDSAGFDIDRVTLTVDTAIHGHCFVRQRMDNF